MILEDSLESNQVLYSIGSKRKEGNGSVQSDQPASENSNKLSRRRFLQIVSVGSAATVAGCANDAQQIIYPNVRGQVEQIPGAAVWYSSTCTECSAGCGIQVRTREGRAVKIEGNPKNPINRGGLCALGQSALQNLYDPDRVRQPLKRVTDNSGNTVFRPVSWEEALSTVAAALADSKLEGGKKKRVFLTGHVDGTLKELIENWSKQFSADHIVYEALEAGALAKACELTFGLRGIPNYHFDKAEVLLNFGADIFETWVSPVQNARGWAKTRVSAKPLRVVHVEPRLSLSGANADHWISPNPGTEIRFAMAVLKLIVQAGRGAQLSAEVQEGLKTLTGKVDIAAVAAECGVPIEKILLAANYLKDAKHSLVLAGGAAAASEKAIELQVLCNLINLALGNVGLTVEVGRMRPAHSSPKKLAEICQDMRDQKVSAAFISGANPAFNFPADYGFDYAVKMVPLVVSFSSHLDESARLAHLILPAHTALESWGDSNPYNGVHCLQQPVMKPVFDTRHLGDMLLDLAKRGGKSVGGAQTAGFVDLIKERWKELSKDEGSARQFENFWRDCLEQGGHFAGYDEFRGARVKADPAIYKMSFEAAVFAGSYPDKHPQSHSSEDDLVLMAFPSVKTFDGRAANRPWLQEIADPISQVVWDSWAELHPDTAARLKLKQGDIVSVRNFYGELNIPVLISAYVHPQVVAVPLGQGHSSFGRYAEKVGGGNTYSLLSAAKLNDGEGIRLLGSKVQVKRSPGKGNLVRMQGSDSQMDRDLARTTVLAATASGGLSAARHDAKSHHHEIKQMYDQREHPVYRWGLAVDLAACTGCSACVVACYAENNIPVVGKERCDQGREMSWLRIERYYDGKNFNNKNEPVPAEELSVSFLPMMCQQCGNAPCEPVCPVYATYHNEEGLNAMVYNRCVGTRYCSNNCSYKVRRFNWFDYEVPEPLTWQLNPDVTKRTTGIMEKCTFCVQRIAEAKDHAKDEGRLVKDGEVQPACVQSCPTEALAFGNLNDPGSKVSRLSKHTRAYKVLDYYINTLPAVTYLERIRYAKS